MTFDLADIITISSVLELFLFSIFLLLKNIRPNYNKALVVFFFFQIIGILSWIFTKHVIFPELAKFLEGFTLLWAPSLYLYAESLTKQNFKFRRKTFYHAFPFILFLLYYSIGLVKKLPPPPIDIIVTIQVNVYIIVGLYILFRYHRKVKENFSEDEAKTRNWLAVVMLGYAIACLIPPITYYLGFYQQQTSTVKEIISFFPFLIFYNILFFNAIGNTVVVHDIPKEEKYTGSPLTDDLAKQYLEKLDRIVAFEKCFLEPELTLGELSDKLGIHSRYLSQIINQYKQKTFYDFINGLRTEYACSLLSSNSKKTILEILFESGFNSKTSFNTAFKKYTGVTPSQYKARKNGSAS